jgi:hypothetical protein
MPKKPETPKKPEMPEKPEMPKAPGMPEKPELPEVPEPPALPTVTEVWTSTQLQIPVLTRITGPFGKQTCHCKNLSGAEPPPSLFEIPEGYKKA